MPFNARDVLDRAIGLIAAHPLSNACSDWCPWCAIGYAKNELDNEYGVLPPVFELLRYAVTGQVTEGDADVPLSGARDALKPFRDVKQNDIDQDSALEMLRFAKDSLKLQRKEP